jgi:hypothetical protein
MTSDEESGYQVRLCGQLTAEYLPSLRDTIPADRPVRLDLGDVTFVDRESMEFLCSLRSRNVAIENIPSYVKRWIEQERRCNFPKEG